MIYTMSETTTPPSLASAGLPYIWGKQLLRYQPALLNHLQGLLNRVAVYLPQLVARPLLENPAIATLAVPIEGTVMFADIDGFTAMSERFSQVASTEGAEELTELINRFLAILIKTAGQHGGDLQKFGGDAGMLLFSGEDHALHAIAAALDVQQAMDAQLSRVETSLGCFPLRIAIGLGSGRLAGVGLGNAAGREWVLTGPPLKAMGRAQELAPPGGVVVDPGTYALCETAVQSSALPHQPGFLIEKLLIPVTLREAPPLPSPPQGSKVAQLEWLLARLDALNPYLPDELLERLTTAVSLEQTRQWSEHRQVTILMLSLATLPDFSIFGTDPERLQRVAEEPNAQFVRIRDIIQRYDGIVNKISASPQGNYLMALFGAPKAHEDDPLRAVLAALELQSQADIPLRIGINSGFVFAGDVGTVERREYTVMGDEVNLAYRLMSASTPGEVLLGPNTAQHGAVSRRVVGEYGPPQHFKGKQIPIAPFVVQRLRPLFTGVDTALLPLVDREDDLAQLHTALRAVRAGHSRVVRIHGEAGIGKSRLAQEVITLALQHGFAIHTGVAPSYGGHLPYAAWESPLLSLLELETLPQESRGAALHSVLARRELAPWGALVAPLVGAELPPSPEVNALSPALQTSQRIETVCRLWEHAAREKPCLLLIENAQWMAEPSLELLEALMQSPPEAPLLLLVTYRDDPALAARWEALAGEAHSDLALGSLSSRATRVLLKQAAQGGELPREVERWLIKQGGQTPFYCIEALQTLIASGVLEKRDQAWELTQPLENVPLPETVYGLVQSRIDQLEPPSRHLLRAAAVSGEQLTVAMLVAGYGEESLLAVKDRLPRLNPLGVQYGDPEEETLVFRQPLVREVAYRGLAFRMQRLIHRRLAEFLDQYRTQATSNWLTLLAYHAFEGQDWPAAVKANLELGQQLQRNYLTQQAVKAFERALEAADAGNLPAEDERFEAHHLLGDTLAILGQYESALKNLKTAITLVPALPTHPTDIARLADLQYHIASILESQGKYQEAFEAIDNALTLPNIADTIEGARLYLRGGALHYQQANYEEGEIWTIKAVRISKALKQELDSEAEEVEARGLYILALLDHRRGKLKTAVELCKESLAIYRKNQDLLGEVRAHINLMVIYVALGQWNLAVTHGEQGQTIARRARYAEGEAQLFANLGEVYRYQGKLELARDSYVKVLNIAREYGITYGEALMENNLATLAIREKNLDEAHQRLKAATLLFENIGAQNMYPELYRNWGELSLASDEINIGIEWCQRSLETAELHGATREAGHTWRLLSKLYLIKRETELAKEAITKALAYLQNSGDAYGLAQTYLVQARVYYQRGNYSKACETLQAAREQFKALGAMLDLEEARALLEQWESETPNGK